MEMPVNISEPGYFGHKIFSSIRRTLQRRGEILEEGEEGQRWNF